VAPKLQQAGAIVPANDIEGKDAEAWKENAETEDTGDGVLFISEVGQPHCIIHPHSLKRISWDLASMIMVLYDMIMVPMFFFDMPDNAFLFCMDWTTRVFWTLDMTLSVRTAIIMKDGSVNFDWKFILKRYIRTWLVLDIFIVGTDWSEVALSSAGDAEQLMSITRAFRIARIFRLMRLLRMQEVLKTIAERVQSDILSFVLTIVRSILFVVCFSHVTACVWWGIGDPQGEDHGTWATLDRFQNTSVGMQYLVSLHWSLAQFSGGMDEVYPQSVLERFFAVMIWLFAFMSSAIILSVLTSNLTQLHIIGGSQSRQLATLRKYLKQNFISSNLALRMQRSAQHAISGDLTQDAVELLPVVAEPLRVEMHFEMYTPMMRCHQFFAEYISECPQVMRRVCHYATGILLLSQGDIVFSKGEDPADPKMYFVSQGMLEYKYGDVNTFVNEKSTASEAVLWTRWTYRGVLTSLGDVKLATLDSKMFREIVDRFKEVGGFDPKVYAADFVAHLNSLVNNADEGNPLTDLTTVTGNAK